MASKGNKTTFFLNFAVFFENFEILLLHFKTLEKETYCTRNSATKQLCTLLKAVSFSNGLSYK